MAKNGQINIYRHRGRWLLKLQKIEYRAVTYLENIRLFIHVPTEYASLLSFESLDAVTTFPPSTDSAPKVGHVHNLALLL